MNTLKTLIALLALSLAACSTVPDAPQASVECPEVACGWDAAGSCAEGATYTHESSTLNLEGETCHVFTAACVAGAPVAPACVPDACKQAQYATCEGK